MDLILMGRCSLKVDLPHAKRGCRRSLNISNVGPLRAFRSGAVGLAGHLLVVLSAPMGVFFFLRFLP